MLSFFRRQSPRRDDLLRNNGFVLPPSSKDGLALILTQGSSLKVRAKAKRPKNQAERAGAWSKEHACPC